MYCHVFFAYIHNEGNVIFHWEVSKRRNFLSHHGTPEFSPWTHGHMQYPECRKLYKCIYLYLLPLPEMWHFLWALSIIFLALITTILGSCWNKAVWLATVEYLSQRVEATVLKILDLKLQTCALWCCVSDCLTTPENSKLSVLATALPRTIYVTVKKPLDFAEPHIFLARKNNFEKTFSKFPFQLSQYLTWKLLKTSFVFWWLTYQKSSLASRTESLTSFLK